MKNPATWMRILILLIIVAGLAVIVVVSQNSDKTEPELLETASPLPTLPTNANETSRGYVGLALSYDPMLESVASFPDGFDYGGEHWKDITPNGWIEYTDWQLIKHDDSGITCLIDSDYNVWPVVPTNLSSGKLFYGLGLVDTLLFDCDADGNYELIVSCSIEVNGVATSFILYIDLDNIDSLTSWETLNLSMGETPLLLSMDDQGYFTATPATLVFNPNDPLSWTIEANAYAEPLRFIYTEGTLRLPEESNEWE
ncbi:MAG: hypothetical protein Q4C01_06060 [Clostridia bacterium]|nr:hypothetical protein [Clostridia bacterium]